MTEEEKAIHNEKFRAKEPINNETTREPVEVEVTPSEITIEEQIKLMIGLAKPKVSKERLEICKACPRLRASSVCSLCGCFMQAKTKLENATCPENKW
jgi:molybdenum cofactor biosynthesis enzyme MoaA|tara:strand:- start:2030 stop:2323 length:294 start_codon:yes stop_codon:yes gene_type:complete